MTKARARMRAKAKAARNGEKRKTAEAAPTGSKPGKFDPGSSRINKARNGFDGGNFATAGRSAGRGR